MLTNTDLTEDPGETWQHIELEMERLLETVGSLKQPNRVADIERRLLGVVLKEENAEKIEKIREECKTGRKGRPNQGQVKMSIVEEERFIEEGDRTMDDREEVDGEIEVNEMYVKEIQVDTMDRDVIVVTQEIEREIVEENKVVYVTGSTQTSDILEVNKEENIGEIIKEEMVSKSEMYSVNKNKTTVEECCHALNKENNNNNNKHIQQEKTTNQPTEAIHDIEKPSKTNNNNNNNNKSNTLIKTQTKEELVLPKIVDSYTELHKKAKRDFSLDLKEKLPKLICREQQQQQQQQQSQRQKYKKYRIKSTRASKTSSEFKVNSKPDEYSRHKVYMHLPVATTQNKGLGLNPSINRVKSSMYSIPSRNGPRRDRIQSTPLQIILKKATLQFSSDRERAITVV